jgi:hypothetical protein
VGIGESGPVRAAGPQYTINLGPMKMWQTSLTSKPITTQLLKLGQSSITLLSEPLQEFFTVPLVTGYTRVQVFKICH